MELFYRDEGDKCFLLPGQSEMFYCHLCNRVFTIGDDKQFLNEKLYHSSCLDAKKHAASLPSRIWGEV